MTWTNKLKNIATTNVVGHVNSDPNLIERAPASACISFTPLELYGAAARCSQLSFVNPLIATTESDMIAMLIGPHVDDMSNDFAILASADNFKDYVKSYFSGTVATGLAYLAMTNEKYAWGDHFENVGGGNTAHSRKPDFVFGGLCVGVALMESKGSRSGSLTGFDATVLDGYTDQIEPHLGHLVGNAMATHGYCIGAWLKSTTKGELRIHHTKVATPAGPASATATPSLATIKRHNFATAFSLAHSFQLGASLRRGESSYSEIFFLRTRWLDRNWLTYFGAGALAPLDHNYWRLVFDHYQYESPPWLRSYFFAIEETIATTALRIFLGGEGEASAEGEIAPIEEGIRVAAREYRGEGIGGAVFPDGLAIFDQSKQSLKFEPTLWDVARARLLV